MSPPKRPVPVSGGVVYTSKPDHTCMLPASGGFVEGDIFQCNRCVRQYVLKDDQRDGRFWMAQ